MGTSLIIYLQYLGSKLIQCLHYQYCLQINCLLMLQIDYKDRYQSISLIKADLFRAEHNIMFLAIPGFRSSNPFHIVVATFFYIFLLYTCFFNTYVNIDTLNICIFISVISFTFILFNYLDVHRFLPFAKSKNLVLRYLSIIIYSLIIPATLIASFIIFYK